MATAIVDDLLDRVRDAGLRATAQRRAIIQALLDQPAHTTAEELTALVNVDHPDVHVATVYRTLEVLESVGVLFRLSNGHLPTQWHLTDRAHQHLLCDRCGRAEEVSSAAFARLATSLAKEHGFALDLRHLAVRGLCRQCAAETERRDR